MLIPPDTMSIVPIMESDHGTDGIRMPAKNMTMPTIMQTAPNSTARINTVKNPIMDHVAIFFPTIISLR